MTDGLFGRFLLPLTRPLSVRVVPVTVGLESSDDEGGESRGHRGHVPSGWGRTSAVEEVRVGRKTSELLG